MKTVTCNSLQSFWDMADHKFLENLNVHCVFPVTGYLKNLILSSQSRYKIRNITFSQSVN